MTRALVEDSTGRLFGGQSTSHHPSEHRENRNVLLDGGSGRIVGKPEVVRQQSIASEYL
jgi:hypothetical protein